MIINKMKKCSLKGFQIVLLGAPILIAGCGGSTTVADRPDNLTGSFSGSVASSAGGSGNASLTIIQGSSTTAGTDTMTEATMVSITGSLSVILTQDCVYAISFTGGTQTSAQTILTGDSASLSLNGSGSRLSGSITFTGMPQTFTNDAGETVNCPIPQGAANFS